MAISEFLSYYSFLCKKLRNWAKNPAKFSWKREKILSIEKVPVLKTYRYQKRPVSNDTMSFRKQYFAKRLRSSDSFHLKEITLKSEWKTFDVRQIYGKLSIRFSSQLRWYFYRALRNFFPKYTLRIRQKCRSYLNNRCNVLREFHDHDRYCFYPRWCSAIIWNARTTALN